MLAKKQCTNIDCKDYDVVYTTEIEVDTPSTIFCPTCLLGKLNITIERDIESLPLESEEFISADFDLSKIFQR